ncbi:MAG: hypothetical protein OEN55_13740 [Alphaproteobacteria bacterium]|nr:hypothetical protein [Alphaproteobacteria bacterium]
MKPGTNHIVWALCSFILCGTTIVLAGRFHGSDPVYGSGAETAFWMFLGATAVVGLTGTFLLLIGIRERNQYRRTRASISTEPDHKPRSRNELVTRIIATLAATDDDLDDEKVEALRCILAQMEGTPPEKGPLRDQLRKAVSNDIASEILAAEDLLDTQARDFILNSCFLLLDAMDDPGPVQEDLLVRIAAAMGMSELGLSAHQDSIERSAVRVSRFDTTNGEA